jgi:hypothetical protein
MNSETLGQPDHTCFKCVSLLFESARMKRQFKALRAKLRSREEMHLLLAQARGIKLRNLWRVDMMEAYSSVDSGRDIRG